MRFSYSVMFVYLKIFPSRLLKNVPELKIFRCSVVAVKIF